MILKKTDSNRDNLHKTIDKLFEDLSNISPDSPEFLSAVQAQKELYNLRKVDHEIHNDRVESYTKLAAVAANLAGIVMVVEFERTRVLTSKAMQLLQKIL